MTELLRMRITLVWACLVAATALSWGLGTDHVLPGADHRAAGVLILVVAFTKVRFVGLYFMELRDAPLPLRAFFEAYCLIVCALVTGMFLLA